jgi:hypothetical protein
MTSRVTIMLPVLCVYACLYVHVYVMHIARLMEVARGGCVAWWSVSVGLWLGWHLDVHSLVLVGVQV